MGFSSFVSERVNILGITAVRSQSGRDSESSARSLLSDTCSLLNWQSLLGGPGRGLEGPTLSDPSYSSSAFPLSGLHPVLRGRKLSAVRVGTATVPAPLVSLLAISLEVSLVSKTQNSERGQQMTVAAEMSE